MSCHTATPGQRRNGPVSCLPADSVTPTPQGKSLLSVTVPVCDEQEVIEATHRRITAVLGGRPDLDLEIIYVNDGSQDRTALLLAGIADNDARVSIVTL